MKTLRRIIGLLILGWILWRLIPLFNLDPQARVTRRIKQLEQALSHEGEVGSFAMARMADSVSQFFAPEATVNLQSYQAHWDLSGRAAIRQALLQAMTQIKTGIQVKLTDPVFEVLTSDKVTHIITASAFSGDQENLLLAILEMTWRKDEQQQWRLLQVRGRPDLDWGGSAQEGLRSPLSAP